MYQAVPKNFTDLNSYELHNYFPNLSLLQFPGASEDYLFLSIMLHGNENSGLLILQKILKKYGQQLPRGIIALVGNVDAAKNNRRRMDDQTDFNRIWKFPHKGPLEPCRQRAQEILEHLKSEKIFAGVDIHNNSGRNPPYACINELDVKLVNMAKVFSSICVYFTKPDQVLSIAMNQYFPGITIECGLPGDPLGVENGFGLVDRLLHQEELSTEKPQEEEIKIYHTFATMKVSDRCRLSFEPSGEADIELIPNFDTLNFNHVKVGECIGRRMSHEYYIRVIDDSGLDLSENIISYDRDGTIRFRRSVIPSMLSKNIPIIHQDCLGYLMEEFSLDLLK